MSAAELHALIEQLSADINRQKEVLKELECRKRAAHRQLNAILDPVARLPFEISSEIQVFVQCLPSRERPAAAHAPVLLLNICNAWSDIALSTRALWANIHSDPARQRLPRISSNVA